MKNTGVPRHLTQEGMASCVSSCAKKWDMITFCGMKFAVVKTGGKQYLVRPGQKLKIEKLEAEEGAIIHLGEVLLVVDGDAVAVGTPIVAGAEVEAKILTTARARKIIVFKYKPKVRYRVKRGHRQHYTEVEITKITK